MDYEPSINRGPGDIVGEDAKQLRNSLSNTQTVSKKRKVQLTAAENAGKGMLMVAQAVGGNGLVLSGYLDHRHTLGPRGRPLGENTQEAVNQVFGEEMALECEGFVCDADVLPKYNYGPGFEIGTNKSRRKFSSEQAVILGSKTQFRSTQGTNHVCDERATRLANYGVGVIQYIRQELINQNNENWVSNGGVGAPPGPPTKDEIQAAVVQAFVLGWDNESLAPPDRTGVNADMKDI